MLNGGGHLFCKGSNVHMLNQFVVIATSPDYKAHRALVLVRGQPLISLRYYGNTDVSQNYCFRKFHQCLVN